MPIPSSRSSKRFGVSQSLQSTEYSARVREKSEKSSWFCLEMCFLGVLLVFVPLLLLRFAFPLPFFPCFFGSSWFSCLEIFQFLGFLSLAMPGAVSKKPGSFSLVPSRSFWPGHSPKHGAESPRVSFERSVGLGDGGFAKFLVIFWLFSERLLFGFS